MENEHSTSNFQTVNILNSSSKIFERDFLVSKIEIFLSENQKTIQSTCAHENDRGVERKFR